MRCRVKTTREGTMRGTKRARLTSVPPTHSSNSIGPEGFTAMAAGLTLLTGLQSLRIRCGRVSCAPFSSTRPRLTRTW